MNMLELEESKEVAIFFVKVHIGSFRCVILLYNKLYISCDMDWRMYIWKFQKKDWKLFRACIGEWQEAYMERLTKEYIDLLSGDENASDKFWELEERIKRIRNIRE